MRLGQTPGRTRLKNRFSRSFPPISSVTSRTSFAGSSSDLPSSISEIAWSRCPWPKSWPLVSPLCPRFTSSQPSPRPSCTRGTNAVDSRLDAPTPSDRESPRAM